MSRSTLVHRVRALALVVCATSLCAVLPSCRSTAGKVSDGRYTAHDDVFSLPVPKLGAGEKIQDGTDKDPETGLRDGFVAFHDDVGNARAIEYEELPAAQVKAMADRECAERVLKGFVHDLHMRRLESQFPGTRTITDEAITLRDGSPARFAVFFIPGGSPMTVTNAQYPAGHRLDSTRAYLFLRHDNLFMTLSTSSDLGEVLADNNANMVEKPPDAEHMKTVLTEFYESIRF